MVLRRIDTAPEDFHPAYVVWELTLACDQPCTHCGSRAGTARPGELSTEEALEVVAQLAAMRAREVVLIGGEAYLHPGFLDIIQLQITAPLGRAADQPDLLLQPWDLMDLMPRITRLKEQAYRERILVMPGDNLGYFGTDVPIRGDVPGGIVAEGPRSGQALRQRAVRDCPRAPGGARSEARAEARVREEAPVAVRA